MAIIDEIRRSAEESNSIVLKQTELIQNLNTTLEVELFVHMNDGNKSYEDIKVKEIIALERPELMCIEEPSWINLLKNYIEGSNWRDEVIDYFEDEIKDKYFPAREAYSTLSMANYGGLLACSNGIHRMIGAACWLVSKYGDEAVLKKVFVTTFSLNDYFKQLLEIVKDEDEIYLFKEQENNEHYTKVKELKYVKIVNRKLNYINYYELKDDNLVNIGSLKYKYFVINFINNFLQERDIEMKSLGNYINKIWTPMNKHYFEIMKRNLKNQTTAEV